MYRNRKFIIDLCMIDWLYNKFPTSLRSGRWDKNKHQTLVRVTNKNWIRVYDITRTEWKTSRNKVLRNVYVYTIYGHNSTWKEVRSKTRSVEDASRGCMDSFALVLVWSRGGHTLKGCIRTTFTNTRGTRMPWVHLTIDAKMITHRISWNNWKTYVFRTTVWRNIGIAWGSVTCCVRIKHLQHHFEQHRDTNS